MGGGGWVGRSLKFADGRIPAMANFLARLNRGVRHLGYVREFLRCFLVFRSPLRTIFGYLWLPVSYPFFCVTRSGDRFRVINRSDLATVWIIYLRNEYNVRLEDKVILDGGANIGAFSVFAASRAAGARIFAVEPFPSTFDRLEESVRANHLEDRVTCMRVALASEDQNVNMYAATHVDSQARQVIKPSGPDTVRVPALSLSSLLERIGVAEFDLLKMDIEGGEHPVVLHTDARVLSRFKRISIEYHQTGEKKPLFQHLMAAGFVLRRDRVLGFNYGVAEFLFEGKIAA